MLIAIAGRMRSGCMHTPTTTTRENSGAPVMIWSMTPGTPTHSKTTGCFGVAAPTASAACQTRCHGTSGMRRSFSIVADGEVEDVGGRDQVAVPAGRRER